MWFHQTVTYTTQWFYVYIRCICTKYRRKIMINIQSGCQYRCLQAEYMANWKEWLQDCLSKRKTLTTQKRWFSIESTCYMGYFGIYHWIGEVKVYVPMKFDFYCLPYKYANQFGDDVFWENSNLELAYAPNFESISIRLSVGALQ